MNKLTIKIDSEILNGTYFTMSDLTPVLDEAEGVLTVQNGKGSRRGWGTPTVTSTVVVNAEGFTAIHVGGWTKHGGCQGFHYWLGNRKVTWAGLDNAKRQMVLDGAAVLPVWAKAPGELKVAKGASAKAGKGA